MPNIQLAPRTGGSFINLPDTPAAYAGQAGKFLRVNAVPDAIEFVTNLEMIDDSFVGLLGGGRIVFDSTPAPDQVNILSATLRVGYDTNLASFFGRAAVGYCGANDYASFAHVDMNVVTSYALVQSATGSTTLNAAATRQVTFAINAADEGHYNSVGFYWTGGIAQFSNEVGIGAAPAAGVHLHIQHAGIARAWIIGGNLDDQAAQMVFGESDVGGHYAEFIRWANADVSNPAEFIIANLDHEIHFSTKFNGAYRNDLYIDSDGKIGFGTATIPHGAVGAAMFAIEGTNASVAGPHVQFTTASDDYPLLQIFSYSHDIIALCLDSYYDFGVADWLSSDVGSNFQIYKLSDELLFRYDSGIAQGDPIVWNQGIVLRATGVVEMPAYGIGDAQFLAGGVITSVSDKSLKRDVHDTEVGLAEVLQMQGKCWRFTKESGLNDENNTIYQGFIADDIEKIVPTAVGRDPQGMRTMSYSALMPAFAEAFREVDARLEQLEEHGRRSAVH